MNSRGLFLIKPDAAARGLRDIIVKLIVEEGFAILHTKSIQLDEALIRAYQPVMNEPSEFGEEWKHEVLMAQTSGLSEVLVVERVNALEAARALKKRIRSTYAPGAHYHQRVIFNLLHSPDTEEELINNWHALVPECEAMFSKCEAMFSKGSTTLPDLSNLERKSEMSLTHTPLVILEGLPGAGKTSLLDLLHAEFFCVPESLPGFSGEAAGQEDFLRHDFAKLRAGRDSGTAALVDRGYASTLAWNYARLIVDGALDYYSLLGYAAKRMARQGCRPDLYIVIDVDPATSLARKNRPVLEADLWTRPEYLAASGRFYEHYFAAVEPQVPCRRISGNEPLEAIATKILLIVNELRDAPA